MDSIRTEDVGQNNPRANLGQGRAWQIGNAISAMLWHFHVLNSIPFPQPRAFDFPSKRTLANCSPIEKLKRQNEQTKNQNGKLITIDLSILYECLGQKRPP